MPQLVNLQELQQEFCIGNLVERLDVNYLRGYDTKI